MKIILSNYRYFISGGPEGYLFAIKEELEKQGHHVIPFSVRSEHNVETEWERYFISALGNGRSVYFDEYGKELSTLFKVMERSLYSPEGFFRARRLARAAKADLVYSLHFLNKMSPSIIDGFKSSGLPVVVRLSDFELLCPEGHFLRAGVICEKCINGGFLNAIFGRCVKNSLMGSLIKGVSWSFHRVMGIYKRIDAFVCPSAFMQKKMIAAGFPEKKVFHVPSFINPSGIKAEYGSNRGHILYFGRFAKEKGLNLLLEAYRALTDPKPDLIIAGGSLSEQNLGIQPQEMPDKVHLKPFLPKEKLFKIIRNAIFVVVPSTWYENMPNTILESFAHGKPVIASRIGSLPELVIDGETGYLFEPGNAMDLCQKMENALGKRRNLVDMGKIARNLVETNYSVEKHYAKLMGLFEKIVNSSSACQPS